MRSRSTAVRAGHRHGSGRFAIVRAVIDLASAMHISAVAEGVETADQVAELRALGCPIGQGFFFSRPLSAPQFDELLAARFADQGTRPIKLHPGRLVG